MLLMPKLQDKFEGSRMAVQFISLHMELIKTDTTIASINMKLRNTLTDLQIHIVWHHDKTKSV